MIKKLLKKLQSTVYTFLDQDTFEMMERFLWWFEKLIRIHFSAKLGDFYPKKWDIYIIDLWRNVSSEIGKNRPCVIFTHKKMNHGDGLIVIPMKTYRWKIRKKWHILIRKDESRGILRDNIIDVSQMRYVSKKRITSKKIWVLDDEIVASIENKILYIFDIQKK